MDNLALQKSAILHWAAQWPYALVLDNCASTTDRYGQYELLVGVAQQPENEINTWEKLSTYSGWAMGLLPYNLKNNFEKNLTKDINHFINFPEIAWFIPEKVVAIRRDSTEVVWLLGEAESLPTPPQPSTICSKAPNLFSNFTKDQYLSIVEKLRDHIRDGDCYEINLAQAFTAEEVSLNPVAAFEALTAVSPVPFAAFFRWKSQYVVCASPERFLQKQGSLLVSQPIKGTARRGHTPDDDLAQQTALRHSLKEQAENVMIVDLTRNDLHRSCQTGSVAVPYLFEIQTFPTVHQMVSTITGQALPTLSWQQVVANTFPPGSMTGAPKVMAMELISRYEGLARGAYAGSLGYCKPAGDFDLNVVIRSMIWDATQQKLSYHVGGAITYDSDPAAEYAETLLKAVAIEKVLAKNSF